VDLERLNAEFFGKQPEDPLIGNLIGCYVGHSNDEGIRFDSSSGGVVTQLLVYALEKGVVDGVLVTRMSKERPLEPEPFIARTRKEVVSAAKSKYCPVAANVALKEIMSEEGRFAVVGLPCHMHGVRMAEKACGELKSKIALHVGLFCSHTVSFGGTDCLLRKFGVDRGQVAKLDYRGRGWPGCMSIQLKGGRDLRMRFVRGWNAYWNVFSGFFFAPLRCLMCPDHFNELSDVSIGDAWLPELRGSKFGEAVLVTRTAFAEELVASMKRGGVLSLKAVSPRKVKESQAFSLNFKKAGLAGRLALLRKFGRNTPVICPKPGSSGFLASVDGFLSYLSFLVSSSRRLRLLLAYVPLPLFRVYFGLFKCSFLLSQR
jgi:coenzyme F420 hydrogenase subunit beta